MSPARTLENNEYETGEKRTRDPSFGGYIALPPKNRSRVRLSPISYLLFSNVRAEDIVNGYSSILQDITVACGEGRAPGINAAP